MVHMFIYFQAKQMATLPCQAELDKLKMEIGFTLNHNQEAKAKWLELQAKMIQRTEQAGQIRERLTEGTRLLCQDVHQ